MRVSFEKNVMTVEEKTPRAVEIKIAPGKSPKELDWTVLDGADWYTHVTVIGRVTEIYDDEDLADIDALSRQYTDQEYPQRDRPRVSALIEVDRVHGWGSQKNNDQPDGRQ